MANYNSNFTGAELDRAIKSAKDVPASTLLKSDSEGVIVGATADIDYATSTYVDNLVENKQDVLTPGDNITIEKDSEGKTIISSVGSIHDLNIENGSGENSLKQKGNATALGNNSIAYGTSRAGGYGFVVTAVDTVNKTVTVSDSTGIELDFEGSLYLSKDDGTYDNNYCLFGKVTEINGNIITFDEMELTGWDPEHTGWSVQNSYIWFTGHTDLVVYGPDGNITEDFVLIGDGAIAEGTSNVAYQIGTHAEGIGTQALGKYSHAEGRYNIAGGYCSHTEGYDTKTKGLYSHAEGRKTQALNDFCHTEGNLSEAYGMYSHAEGWQTYANNTGAHTEGRDTISNGIYAHAEGLRTHAEGEYSHSEGRDTYANGDYSHTTGINTVANGECSTAQGYNTQANGTYSFASGHTAIANGTRSISVGYNTTTGSIQTVPVLDDSENPILDSEGNQIYKDEYIGGQCSAVFGQDSKVEGNYSIVSGIGINSTSNNQAVFGRYNDNVKLDVDGNNNIIRTSNANDALLIVGGGASASSKSNKFEVETNGSIVSGSNNVAKSVNSAAIGLNNRSLGDQSITLGQGNISTGNSSFTANANNKASGSRASAFGEFNESVNRNQLVCGSYNDSTNSNSLFTVGNGTSAVRANVFDVRKDGTIVSGTSTCTSSNSVALGNKSNISSVNSFAAGLNNTVSADQGAAVGYGNTVQGNSGFACGASNTIGINASRGFVGGASNIVNGNRGFALGENNTVNGAYTGALGRGLNTSSTTQGQLVVGKYNADSNSIFVVGNGNSNSDRSNILEIDNDKVRIDTRELTIDNNGLNIQNNISAIGVDCDSVSCNSTIDCSQIINYGNLTNRGSIWIGPESIYDSHISISPTLISFNPSDGPTDHEINLCDSVKLYSDGVNEEHYVRAGNVAIGHRYVSEESGDHWEDYLKIGNTYINETQLQKLLALISGDDIILSTKPEGGNE